MVKIGFHNLWINIVMKCVKSMDFAVTINGQPGRKFERSCGLRQRDLLSPYLFLLVSEVLSMLIKNNVDMDYIHGIRISNEPCPSHLLFVDDTLILL